ncbi:MAG: hypothetical protein IJG86_04000 [Clostridia bacterium]|nr:hypothetical protein [Clostridia bacterium]
MNDKQKAALKDAVALIILALFMFFVVKGVPALMGGVKDANGNPLLIAQTAAILGIL